MKQQQHEARTRTRTRQQLLASSGRGATYYNRYHLTTPADKLIDEKEAQELGPGLRL